MGVWVRGLGFGVSIRYGRVPRVRLVWDFGWLVAGFEFGVWV